MSQKNSPKSSNLWVSCDSFSDQFCQSGICINAQLSNTLQPFQSIYGEGQLMLQDQKLLFCQDNHGLVFVQLNDQITYQVILDEETKSLYILLIKGLKQSFLQIEYEQKEVIDQFLQQFLFKLDFYSTYNLTQLIGQDEFFQISQVQKKSDGISYICKNYYKSKLNANVVEKRKFLNYIKMLRTLNNKYIIQGYEFFESDNNYKIVIQNYEGKKLSDKIKEVKSFTLQEICLIIEQILQGLKYLHSNNIVMRKLNMESIQFKYNNSYHLLLDGLQDFQDMKSAPILFEEEQNGYIAPEIFYKKNKKEFNQQCDVFSCGSIFYYLAVGAPLFTIKNQTDAQVQKANIINEELKQLPIQVQLLIKQMIEINPNQRPTVDEILERMPYLLNAEEKKIICEQKGVTQSKKKEQKLFKSKTLDFSSDCSSPTSGSRSIVINSPAKIVSTPKNNKLIKQSSFNFSESSSYDNSAQKYSFQRYNSSYQQYKAFSPLNSNKNQTLHESIVGQEKTSLTSLFKTMKNSSFFIQPK